MTETRLPPGPKQRHPLQNLVAFRTDAIAFLRGVARDYGDFTTFKLGPQRTYLINHPDLIKDVLVTQQRSFYKGRGLEKTKRLLGEGLLTSEEEWHLSQRRLMQPVFHKRHIAAYGATMTRLAAERGELWRDGETRDVADEMMRLTLGIVGKTLFDADMDAEAPEIGAAMSVAIAQFHLLMLPFAERFEHLPIPPVLRFRRAKEKLDAVIYKLIREHREGRRDRGDLLSLLLAAEDEDDARRMTDAQVHDEALTIFLAGHETTANALAWTWLLLSQNQYAESKLHDELASVLKGRAPTVDDLPQLTYTRQIVSESLRLYPPGWIIGRRVVQPVTVSGYELAVNDIVLMAPTVTQVDPRFFPDPGEFRPERWTPEFELSRPKYAYFPFGGGPRICIGENFAWMELILVLATLAQKWRLRHDPALPVEWQPVITLRPKNGIPMTFEAR